MKKFIRQLTIFSLTFIPFCEEKPTPKVIINMREKIVSCLINFFMIPPVFLFNKLAH